MNLIASRSALLVLLVAALLATACGNGDAPRAPTGPIHGQYVGQEIWISYGPAKRGEGVKRIGREKDEARRLVEGLHERVLAGEDIGDLALRHSNAPGGAGRGYTGPLPVDAARPTARDRAIASVKIGQVTPVVEWMEGFWFARRVDLETGRSLEKAWFRAQRLRTRFRVIAILYRGAWMVDEEAKGKVRRTRAQAVARADAGLRELKAGASFEEMAELLSEDGPSAKRGGLAVARQPDRSTTEWIRRQDPGFPDSVLEAAFTTPVGELYPEVIVSPRGVFLVKVEGRREVAQ